FLWWLAAPTLGFFLVAGGFTHFKPNWAAPGYLGLLPLVVQGADRWRARAPRAASLTATIAVALAIGFDALTALHGLWPFVPLPAGADPTADMRGWREAALVVEKAMVDLKAHPGGLEP